MTIQAEARVNASDHPGRLEQRKARTRTAILAAATHLFMERGYGETAMQDVAHEASVGVGTLYGYFGSKEDLLRSVLRDRWRDAIDAITRSVAEEMDEPEQAVAAILAYARYVGGERSLLRDALSLPSSPPSREDEMFSSLTLDGFTRLIERGIAQGTIGEVPARAVVNTLVSTATLAMCRMGSWSSATDDEQVMADLDAVTRKLLRP